MHAEGAGGGPVCWPILCPQAQGSSPSCLPCWETHPNLRCVVIVMQAVLHFPPGGGLTLFDL